MAGPQGKSMSMGMPTRYPVKDHNKPVSSVYFNQVKVYMVEKYPKFVEKMCKHFGEKEWWILAKKEMDAYAFGFEDNQCLFLQAKYKNVTDES